MTTMPIRKYYRTFVTDRISESGNAIASVRPSVSPSVRQFVCNLTFEPVIFDLDLLRVY